MPGHLYDMVIMGHLLTGPGGSNWICHPWGSAPSLVPVGSTQQSLHRVRRSRGTGCGFLGDGSTVTARAEDSQGWGCVEGVSHCLSFDEKARVDFFPP